MKSLMRWIVAVWIVTGNFVHAQTITGTWQGTLNPRKELRIVLIISNASAVGLGADAVQHRSGRTRCRRHRPT